jgi:hypothetical protein
MTLDARARATALKLLTKNGQVIALTQITSGAYDPATGSVAITETVHTGVGVALNYSQDMIDGTTILQSDQRVYLNPQLGATPKAGDKLTFSGVVHSVIASRPLAPAGTVLLHEVQARI